MENTLCGVPNCDHPAFSRGWCRSHYSRWYQTGDVQADKPLRSYGAQGCRVEGCDRKHHSQGLCAMHWHRLDRGQDLGDGTARKRLAGGRVQLLRDLAEPGTDDCIRPLGNTASATNTKIDGVNYAGATALWRLVKGDPGDLLVLHTCGNGGSGCLNIQHLYLGTHAQNMLDKCADGHAARKLTPGAVKAIRQRAAAGDTLADIAQDFMTSPTNVSRIVSRQIWRWVSDD